jgi:2'-5' RNA ligase
MAASLPGLRRTRPDIVHLTLRFFAAATADDLEKIRASMLSMAFGVRQFQVELTGLGAFPDRRHPRVVWIGLVPAEPVHALFRTCEEELRRQGLPGEPRAFAPHLTIGRYRERGPDLTAVLDSQSRRRIGCLPVTQLVLYESRLRPDGPRHIPLFTVALPERDDPLHDRTSQEGTGHG